MTDPPHLRPDLLDAIAPRHALRNWSGLIEVRGASGSWFVSVKGGAPAPPHRGGDDGGAPDLVVVGDPLALAAVIGGYVSLADAYREGQLRLIGDDATVDRFARRGAGVAARPPAH